MSTTYLPNTKLGNPAVNDTGYAAVWGTNLATLDGLTPIGQFCVTTHEQPSASLLIDVSGGSLVVSTGSIVSVAAISGHAVSASATTWLWLDNTGALQSGSSLPTSTTAFPLAKIVAGASTITSIADVRPVFRVVSL